MASLFVLLQLVGSVTSAESPGILHTRISNGLAITPPMGWNSYNHYSCSPNSSIVESNAQALLDLGLKDSGYTYITVDCGWTVPNRTASGTLTWNSARFPKGFVALGEFIHGLGLKFGAYQDGGVKTCMTGQPDQAGSLNHETTDVATFASWGVDLLKYDNCYSDAATNYPNTNYAPSVSPKGHYVTMSNALSSQSRPMIFQICNWGVDFPSLWAPALGHTWRITNDIIPSYKTIGRILNQAVPQTSFAGPGHWLDLDMLEVGNGIFTVAEEQTHFSLWAIIKSPLVIGAALKDTLTKINPKSLSVLKNKDVISYNQDSLGIAASFRRRWTQDYEIWVGLLSGGRTVVAVINLNNVARKLTLDLPDVGFQNAGSVKDIWNGISATNVKTSYTGAVEAHGTLLLELGSTTPAGKYSESDAVVSGNSATWTKIYGATTSNNYTLALSYATPLSTSTSITINSITHDIPSGTTNFTTTLSLNATNNNTLLLTSSAPSGLPGSITITPPGPIFYPSSSFSAIGASTHVTCPSGYCTPSGSKIGNLSPSGSASLNLTSPSTSIPGSKSVNVYFCNNDIAFDTAWNDGTNTRNMTISVNGETIRIEVPLSGRSSELFEVGKGWMDSGVFGVVLPGWRKGVNNVVVGNEGGEKGVVSWGADFVGLEVLW